MITGSTSLACNSPLPGETLIQVNDLSRRFGQKLALDRVTLEVKRGGVFGLIGGNGAGKTTLLRHLLGMLKCQSGSVSVFGLDPVKQPVEVLGQIGYLSEERDLPDGMRVGELLRYMRAFYPSWDEAHAEELRKMFELDSQARLLSLSRGQRARAGLLVALAHRPPLLILDEPSSGLDPVIRRDILGAIIRTIADEGRTVLFSSHLLDEVERVADQVAIIDAGRILLTSSLDQLKENHHRLTVRFPDPRSEAPPLAGLLTCDSHADEWSLVCNGEAEQLRRELDALGGRIVQHDSLSLDEIFISHVAGGRQACGR